jgi:hypothetical protein
LTHLATTVFLYQKHHPEDGRITGRNILVKILQIKERHKIEVHLWVINDNSSNNNNINNNKVKQ